MNRVFTCTCGRQTTEPFAIGGTLYCTICAEQLRPDIVDSREGFNRRTFRVKRLTLLQGGAQHDGGRYSPR